jgi:hypothetical protein
MSEPITAPAELHVFSIQSPHDGATVAITPRPNGEVAIMIHYVNEGGGTISFAPTVIPSGALKLAATFAHDLANEKPEA